MCVHVRMRVRGVFTHVAHVYVITIHMYLCHRSTDYGRTFVNETDKFDRDTVLEWQYISPKQNYVSA